MKRPYILGRHKVKCMLCPKVRLDNEMRKMWDGRIVCRATCWSPKHPNDYPRPLINDGLPVPNANPRSLIETMPVVFYNQPFTRWDSANWNDPTWVWSDDLSDTTGYFGNANL